MAEIEITNLVKTYANGFQAVQGMDLTIGDGEFLVLVGPSGCGKSTTLRMIAGLEVISSGEIRIGDRVVNDLEPGDRDIAMVFQNYALYPHMTVRQNMSFGLRMRKTPASEIQQRVDEAAKVLSIESLLDRKPRELSGGQRQRVAVGRAIVRQPAAFLFDEPLSNLDAKLRVQMRTELARLHHRLKTTTVYVTHDQVEAMTLGDRIVVMKDGVVQQVDRPLEIYHRPANRFVAGFIGSPAMNFVEGKWEQAQFLSDSIRFDLSNLESLPTDAVCLGFRPEDLTLDSDHPELGKVEVDVVERMGHESVIYFELGGTCVARLPGDVDVQPGQSLALHLATRQAHWFDAAGDRIDV